MAKRPVKRPARPAIRYEEFVFRVRQPSTYFNFSLQHDRHADDPYDEAHTLSFIAECIYPKRCKGRETVAHFHPDPSLTEGSEHRRHCKERPKAVASIIVGKSRFEVSGFLPPELCWRVGQAMATGTITSMTTNGQFPTLGHGYLSSVSFHGPEFDPLDYVGESGID